MAAIAFLERAHGVPRDKIAVLSLGCGVVIGPVNVAADAGALSWARPLISQVSAVAAVASESSHHHRCYD
jgi:hypothetical protein